MNVDVYALDVFKNTDNFLEIGLGLRYMFTSYIIIIITWTIIWWYNLK